MRVLNFNLIVALSCLAMISAAPVEDTAATEDFFFPIFSGGFHQKQPDRAAKYVPLLITITASGDSDLIKFFSSAEKALAP